MPLDADRLRLGEERKLLFENYCNGIEIEQLRAPFKRSAEVIERDILFVGRKIGEYRHRRCLRPHPSQGMLPPIPCGTLEEIRLNSDGLLWTLQFIGPETLASELIIPTLRTHSMYGIDDLREASRGVRAGLRR